MIWIPFLSHFGVHVGSQDGQKICQKWSQKNVQKMTSKKGIQEDSENSETLLRASKYSKPNPQEQPVKAPE